jgi:tetratricopeptide (TPR) repeat protein
MPYNEDNRTPLPPSARVAGAAGLLVILVLLTWNVGRAGLASLLTTYAAQSTQIAPANAAVRLSAGNPDAHYVRATILEPTDLPTAISEYRQAALARPEDFVLWLSLARASEMNGDTAGAIAAARQAVPLAPDYAEPHYQLGNILLRAGQKDDAFKELRLAGASNPTLLPGIIDLAWRVSGGNVQFVTRAIEPGTPATYQALGQYFRQRQEVGATIAMFVAAGSAAEQDRRSYLGDLIRAKRFNDAAYLWKVGRQDGAAPGVMVDPGFEQESNLKDPGFGWRLGEKDTGFHLSLDTDKPRQGRSSLKIEFNGDSDPSSPVISQLVLVDPGVHYQLHFAAKSEGLVSGGLPLVVVTDAGDNKVLGQSDRLPTTDGWREYTFDFVVGPSASAIRIELQRQACSKSPCPIFGRLWLDNFLLQTL